MLHSIINPDPKNLHFKFEPFLHQEYNLGLDPDRPVCQFYNPQKPNDSCPNGNLCPNKHVSSMYSNKIVCKHWLRGLCKKSDHCEFLHEYNLRKMPECLFFSKNGFCTQTPECLYLHIDPSSKIPECLNYNKGFCPDGPNCKNRHVRRILCPLFLAGFCPKGFECEYTHPKFEGIVGRLRIKPDTDTDGEASTGETPEGNANENNDDDDSAYTPQTD
ncbi:uncharacterized protein SPAPADRAFT_55266 [Spathaspora passalidarum NRRL Y-27907]|uniref:mRNA 3'-end-processing protein n=1 Tax=Spathaspora passalidarum (strain NRRL Y-27907 / 11-Y1) TaxID=619300 RepID=G3AM86_SPAPN|nr:uncharacterized protein SPAPADRAFT_55266 [Spathaspora passalidarum NRRL Y-27907]EGW33384.1 hypothetical protein SPAPADRAFT_55266 [Spathaspora passalidarum NRRL Y-27907]